MAICGASAALAISAVLPRDKHHDRFTLMVVITVTVLRALERARATAADRAAARVLGVAVGLPVMQVDRTALSFGDRPVEHRVSIIDTRHHDYVNLLSKPPTRNA